MIEAQSITASAADRAAWSMGLLEELAEIGMDLARTVRKQALAQKALQDVGEQAGVREMVGGTITLEIRGDFGLVYGRIARAVRLTVALHARIAEGDDLSPARGGKAEAPARSASQSAAQPAAREASDGDEDCAREPSERLWDDEDRDDDLAGRPFSEVVARIGEDLDFAAKRCAAADEAAQRNGDIPPRPASSHLNHEVHKGHEGPRAAPAKLAGRPPPGRSP